MLKSHFKKRLIAVSLAVVISPITVSSKVKSTFHQDHRNTVKLDVIPTQSTKNSLQAKELALDFLSSNKYKYGLQTNFKDLSFTKVKSSLLGEHYHFQQYLNDIPVDKAEVVVSISKQNQIYKIYNNTFPVIHDIKKSTKTLLGNFAAEELAWDFLQASGNLRITPKSNLTYINLGSDFKLAYKVSMTVDKPFGDWEFYLGAETGQVITVNRIDLPIFKSANRASSYGKWSAFPKNSDQRKYQTVLSIVKAEQKELRERKNNNPNKANATATALVFDPDPVTTLNDDTLEDTSSAASFDAAYFTRTLTDVTLDNGVYSLVGPWVTIADFENPVTAPSTSTDGTWTAKRGDNAFNDAMTYYHIDENQRYIQSLGFSDTTGIQFLSIDIDTDGVDGDDNSHYVPSTNQLAFGHGCVDDNEDIDVILHEYGHAIHTSINSNWGGGDTGAMGEGFGDYWAASYSYSTPNGRSFHPEWAFSWDGHNNCWGGRLLNQTSHRYDPNSTYGAHQIVGGINGDELWSTPLTESLLELLDDGVPRSEVDQIVLESQFGLSSGLKMPDLATSVVATAVSLFPAGSHASVFDRNFKSMDILGDSLALNTIEIISSGSNTIVDPGETATLNVSLQNSGGTTLTGVSSTLTSSTAGVTIGAASGQYADINASESQTNSSPYEFTVPNSHQCGVDVNFTLATNYTDGSAQSSNIEFSVPVGLGNDVSQISSPALSIPDNNTTGVTDNLVLSGAVSGSSISIDMNITHTYRGDMTLTVTSPAGTSVILQTTSNDSAANIIGIYPTTLTPVNSLSAFDNEDHNGTWTLTLVDGGPADLGTLNNWSVISTSPAICNVNEAPIAAVANSNINTDEGVNVVLDASPSSDPENDPLTFSWVQLSGPTVTINNDSSAQANFDSPDVSSNSNLEFEVTVSDDKGANSTATIQVSIADANNNNAPVASVASTTITATEGDSVNLDASSSTDQDGDALSYSWTQTSGTSVTIENSTGAIASFTAGTAGNLTFEVTVSDPSSASDSSSVSVTVNLPNQAPTATITGSTTVNEGVNVSLNGSTSSDPDGDSLTYAWSQTSGPTVTLSNSTSATSNFTAPEVSSSTQLSFELIVSDPDGLNNSASVTITVNDVPESDSSGGGTLSIFSLLTFLLIRRRKH